MPPSRRCCCSPASLRKCQCRQVCVKLLACAPACATSHGSLWACVLEDRAWWWGGLRACAPAFAGELCCQCVYREEKTTWWWFACVHACVVAGEACVWARTRYLCIRRLKRVSQTGRAWSHQTLKSWAMTTSTADAHAHAHTDTQLFSIPPHLLGPGGASQFQCQLCFVFAKHKSRHPEFFFYCILLWKKYSMEGKNFLQNECWLETGCTDGRICVC